MILKGLPLLLLATLFVVEVRTEDNWSWGSEDQENVTSTESTILLETQTDDTNMTTTVDLASPSSEPLVENGTAPTGRFFGFKEKLCKLGLGKNCNKNFQPSAQSHHGAFTKPLKPSNSYGAPAISQASISSYTSYDQHQNVQYKPHGQHALLPAVVPLPPKSIHPIKGIISSLGSTFASLIPSHYKPAKPIAPLPSAHNKPAYDNLKPSYVAPIVHHTHSHTHIHQAHNVPGVSTIQTVTIAPTVITTTIIQPVVVSTIHPTIVTSQTAVWTQIPQPTLVPSPSLPRPSLPPVILEVETSYIEPKLDYTEECQCVPENYCEINDVVSYKSSKDISHLLDARNRKTDIISNATDLPETTNNSTILSIELPSEADSLANEQESDEKRLRRDIKNYPANISIQQFITDAEGHIINGYTPGQNGCNSQHVCCRNPLYPSISPKYTCGRSSKNGLLGRVKTPQYEQGDTEFGEYPWQAAILKSNGNNTKTYVCGGVLVDDLYILTAAHCVDGLNPNDLIVRLGEWDVAQTSEFFQHIEVDVIKMAIHKDFYKGNLQNDIAALTLRSKIDFSNNSNFPHISPVCLPSVSSDFTNQECTVTGWGKDAFGEQGKFQRILKEVSVPVVGRQKCQGDLRRTRLGADFSLQDGMLCAGGEQDKDACKGDGGSPLVCKDPVSGSYHLAGLVSWGIGCGHREVPGVYVDVKHYLPWITGLQQSASHSY